MRRALLSLALALAPALPARAEIASPDACTEAVAADPAAAREEAAVWRRIGGGTPAELCEALALEALGAYASAAAILTGLAENRRRAVGPELRLVAYEDAARLWAEAGRADLALRVLDGLDRLAPTTPARLRLRAQAAAAQGDWPAAVAALDAAIAAEPADAGARALRAAALRRGGDPEAALAAAEAALALAPDLPEALFEAAAARAETGAPAEAGRLWRRLIATHPDHPLATFARRNVAAFN